MSLPLSHINPWTLERERLIDISSVSIKSMYNGKNFDVEWTQNNTILILDAIESTTTSSNVPIEDYNGMQFDASKIGLEYDLSGGQSTNDESTVIGSIGDRKRRSLENPQNAYFNPYLQRVIEPNEMGSSFTWSDLDSMGNRYRRDTLNSNDHTLANLPVNRTIYFDCQNSDEEFCLQGKFTVTNLRAEDLPVLVTLNFAVDLKKVVKVMTEKRDIMVVRTSVELMKTGDEDT